MTPEQTELAKKQRLLSRLADRLAVGEESMADLRTKLDRFEAAYTTKVARLYAELDEIEAQIAEEEYKLVPDDEEIKKKIEELRRRAEESAARAAGERDQSDFRLSPTAAAKKAYRDLARVMHPDLALDTREKERRHGLMADLNHAYSTGDQSKLDRLVEDYRHSPEMVLGDSVGDGLVRVIRQISQVKARLLQLDGERRGAEASELFELSNKMKKEMEEGRDMLSQMAARTRVHLARSRRRLADLKKLNAAAGDYVREKYGMDIGDFR